MIQTNDIHSLTDFKRNTVEHVERLKQTGRPSVLTVNGKAEIVVQDAAAYQKLLDLVDLAQSNAAVAEALEQANRGEGGNAGEAIAEVRRELDLPPAGS